MKFFLFCFIFTSCSISTKVLYHPDLPVDERYQRVFKALGKEGMKMIYVFNFDFGHSLKFVKNGIVEFEGKLTKDMFVDKRVVYYFKSDDLIEFYINGKLIKEITADSNYKIIRVQKLLRKHKEIKNHYLIFFHNAYVRDGALNFSSAPLAPRIL